MERRLEARDAAFDGLADDGDRPGSAAPSAFIADSALDPSQAVEEEEWSEAAVGRLHRALENLDGRTRDIVTRRWLTEPRAKLRELAQEYGVSAERVRQIEAQALREPQGRARRRNPSPETDEAAPRTDKARTALLAGASLSDVF